VLALPVDALHVALEAVGHDLVNLAVVERGAQAAGEPVDAALRAAAERPRNRPKRQLDGVGCKANRSRKIGAQEKKFGHALGPDIGRIALAVRFEPRARSQQRRPRHVRPDSAVARRVFAVVEMHLEHRGGRSRALDGPSDLNVVPPLGVNHRRVGDSLKHVRGFLDVRVERRPARSPAAADVQVQPVQLLPHLGADLFADLPGILTRGSHARFDGLVEAHVRDGLFCSVE
jgi:hypothetical protein